jgi:hypothetical protein
LPEIKAKRRVAASEIGTFAAETDVVVWRCCQIDLRHSGFYVVVVIVDVVVVDVVVVVVVVVVVDDVVVVVIAIRK